MAGKSGVKAVGLPYAVVLCVVGLLAGTAVIAEQATGSAVQDRSAAHAPDRMAQRVPPPSPAHPLAGTQWRLVQFQSMDDAIGTLRPDDPARYTMRLAADGSASMQLNCNRAKGTWTARAAAGDNSGSFRFGPLAMTRAKCPPPSLDEQIAGQAGYIRSYLLRDGRLHLSLMADAGIYTWEPADIDAATAGIPTAPEEGGPRNWEVGIASGRLNLRAGASTSAEIVSTYGPGTILDNLGCQRAEGRVWCDVQPLGGGARGYVAGEFLRPAISPDGRVATGPDDSALRAGRREYDATGGLPCAQTAGQPMTQCAFGVARSGGGYATVVITRPHGGSRAIYFRMGRPIGADTSEADGYPPFRAVKKSDLHEIQVGQERYEIPEAVILGG